MERCERLLSALSRRAERVTEVIARLLSDSGASLSQVASRYPLMVPLALFFGVVANGLATIPARHLAVLASFARDPYGSELFRTYHGETPLFFLLARALGVSTPFALAALSLSFVVAAYIFLWAVACKRWRHRPWMLPALVANLPIGYVLQTWLGLSDGLTVFCTIPILASTSPLVLALSAAVMAMNHTAAPLIILPILALRCLDREDRIRRHQIAASIVAIAAVRFLILPVFVYPEGGAGSRLGYLVKVHPLQWLAMHAAHWPSLVYSLFFGFWPAVLFALVTVARVRPAVAALYSLSIALFYVVIVFTKDATRVFALLSWGPTVWLLNKASNLSREEGRADAATSQLESLVAWLALIGWVFPRLFVWEGDVYAPWLFTRWDNL